MLIFKRQIGETIVIDKGIYVTVLKNQDGKIEVGIDAPRHISVDRLEIHEQKHAKKAVGF